MKKIIRLTFFFDDEWLVDYYLKSDDNTYPTDEVIKELKRLYGKRINIISSIPSEFEFSLKVDVDKTVSSVMYEVSTRITRIFNLPGDAFYMADSEDMAILNGESYDEPELVEDDEDEEGEPAADEDFLEFNPFAEDATEEEKPDGGDASEEVKSDGGVVAEEEKPDGDAASEEVESDGEEGCLDKDVIEALNSRPKFLDSCGINPAIRGRKLDAVLSEIDGLVGADEFKALAHEISDVAYTVKKLKLQTVFAHRNYIFSVNEGDGFDMYVSLLTQLISVTDLFSFDIQSSIVQLNMAIEKEGAEETLKVAKSDINNLCGRMIIIDLTSFIGMLNTGAFSDFLCAVEKREKDNIFVFRVPYLENSSFTAICDEINDVLYARPVSIAPFTLDNIHSLAQRFAKEYDFVLDDSIWSVYDQRIRDEKHFGRFFGMNTVKKVTYEMLFLKAKTLIGKDNEDRRIVLDDIYGITPKRAEDDKSGWEELEELIGIEPIKNQIKQAVSQMKFTSRIKSKDKPCMHMCFRGNPGTGKTTLARIIGKILREEGVLKNGNFYEYQGRELCGLYVGSTAPKTMGICRDAYGSVLFLDEAYALFDKSSENNNDFGKEALATLVAEMENHRDEMVVILAGYSNEMNTFLKGNAGLASRIANYIDFPNFSREDLLKMFIALCEKYFSFDKEFEKEAKKYFDSIPDEVLNSSTFANGRFVRNLYQRTYSKAATSRQLSGMDSALEGDAKPVLTKQDLLLATMDSDFADLMTKKRPNKFGFV